jgi:hypothetical protein
MLVYIIIFWKFFRFVGKVLPLPPPQKTWASQRHWNHPASYLILAKGDQRNSPLFSKLRILPLIPWGWGSTFLAIVTSNYIYYLFKKFMVSDWLTANWNCHINSMANQIWIFHIHISKMTSKVSMKKIWMCLRHITMTTRIILTHWCHWYDDDNSCRRTKELFFS